MVWGVFGHSPLTANSYVTNKLKCDHMFKPVKGWENTKHGYDVLGRKPSMGGLGRIGVKSKSSKPLLQYDLNGNFIKEFAGASEAARQLNLDFSKIAMVCRGGRKTHGNYKFKYKFKN